MAREMGLMTTIGEWTFREACRRLQTWHAAFPQIRPLTVSVNFFRSINSRTRTSPSLYPSSLKIEIAESDMMENPDAVAKVLTLLKTQQIEACLDDFGNGYSSLSHLQQLPIQYLKIDQTFIRRLGVDDDALAIVKTIIVLAHQLGRQVIAEGVETVEHRSILRSLGCEYGQGYLFAKPLSCEDVSSLLSGGRGW